MTDLQERIMHAQIAGCNCMTKTGEIEHHAETCRYRLLAELGKLIELADGAIYARVGGEAFVCDPCATKYYNARHGEGPIEVGFQLGDYVEKNKGDYTFAGRIVGVVHKRRGGLRYVVEDFRGMLMILNESQLEPGYPTVVEKPSSGV